MTPQRSSVRPDRLIFASLLVAGLAAGCGGDDGVGQVFGAFDGASRVDFGEVAVVADTPVSRVLEVGNKGNYPLTVTALGLQGDDPSVFAVVGVDGPLVLPFTVDPGTKVTAVLEFTPTSPRRYEAEVVVQANLPTPARIVVSGIGLDVACVACEDSPEPACEGDTLVRRTLGATCPGRDLCEQSEARTRCSQGCNSDLGACNECGNGTVDPGEVCDGAAHGDATCDSVAGLDTGALRCNANCGGFDSSGCKQCGNGIIEADEVCDEERFQNGSTCMDRGFSTGTLNCVECNAVDEAGCSTCGDGQITGSEVCDGTSLDGSTCGSATSGARPEGELRCQANCLALDATACSACGNGVREAAELCDGADLAGTTCQSLGSGQQGTVTCNADCAGFDDSGCGSCGNGSIEGTEACDGSTFTGQTCANYNHTSGGLLCTASCLVNGSGCYTCGDGQLNGPELCDGANLGSSTCASVTGLASGTLRCASNGACLAFDTTGCNTCGNGIVEGTEQCEPSNLGGTACTDLGFSTGNLTCDPTTCRYVTTGCSTCGNGVVDGAEACDGTNLDGNTCLSRTGRTSGSLTCRSDCSAFDVTACYTCGDGRIEGPEACDGGALNSQTCGTRTGLNNGTLRCEASCLGYDITDCHSCGNGQIEGPELCDGNILGARTCNSETGRASGNLACNANCRGINTTGCYECGDGQVHGPEACDGANLRGGSCFTQTPSHVSGQLACALNCLNYGATACFTCGNNQVEGPELCDGLNIGAASCSTTSGFTDGTPTCDSTCMSLDATGCHTCGNASIEGPEVCDGNNLNGQSCTTVASLSQGSLACAGDCNSFDSAACYTCGDNVRSGPEQCDGTDIGGQTCTDFGRPSGTLFCYVNCALDLSLCAQCGNGVCEPALGENSENCPAECGWAQMSLGGGHGCGVRNDGSGHCWGSNGYGQLGTGDLMPCAGSTCRVLAQGAATWSRISAGDGTTCGVTVAGDVFCWGYNQQGAAGAGLPLRVATPTLVGTVPAAADTTVQHFGAMARTSAGQVYTWGSNTYGFLGRSAASPAPGLVLGYTDVAGIASGFLSACIRRSSGRIVCWGLSADGQVGSGASGGSQALPVDVPGVSDAVSIAAGYTHCCILESTGRVMCWGNNSDGQLGRGTTVSSSIPLEVVNITDAVRIQAVGQTSCAVRTNGSVVCWGRGLSGELGNGTLLNSSVPLPVPGLTAVREIYGSSRSASGAFCAQRSNGEIWCWGQSYGTSPVRFGPR